MFEDVSCRLLRPRRDDRRDRCHRARRCRLRCALTTPARPVLIVNADLPAARWPTYEKSLPPFPNTGWHSSKPRTVRRIPSPSRDPTCSARSTGAVARRALARSPSRGPSILRTPSATSTCSTISAGCATGSDSVRAPPCRSSTGTTCALSRARRDRMPIPGDERLPDGRRRLASRRGDHPEGELAVELADRLGRLLAARASTSGPRRCRARRSPSLFRRRRRRRTPRSSGPVRSRHRASSRSACAERRSRVAACAVATRARTGRRERASGSGHARR